MYVPRVLISLVMVLGVAYHASGETNHRYIMETGYKSGGRVFTEVKTNVEAYADPNVWAEANYDVDHVLVDTDSYMYEGGEQAKNQSSDNFMLVDDVTKSAYYVNDGAYVVRRSDKPRPVTAQIIGSEGQAFFESSATVGLSRRGGGGRKGGARRSAARRSARRSSARKGGARKSARKSARKGGARKSARKSARKGGARKGGLRRLGGRSKGGRRGGFGGGLRRLGRGGGLRGLASKAKGFAAGAKGKLQGAMGKMKGKLQGAMGKIKGKLQGKLQGAVGKIKDKIKGAVDKVKDRVKGAVEKVKSKVKEGIEKAKSKLQQAAAAIKEKASAIKDKVKGAIENVKGKLKGKFQGVVDKVKGKFQGVVDKVKGKVKGAIDKVKGKIQGAVAKVKGKIQGAIEKVKGKVKALGDKIKGKVQGVIDKVKAGAAKLADKFGLGTTSACEDCSAGPVDIDGGDQSSQQEQAAPEPAGDEQQQDQSSQEPVAPEEKGEDQSSQEPAGDIVPSDQSSQEPSGDVPPPSGDDQSQQQQQDDQQKDDSQQQQSDQQQEAQIDGGANAEQQAQQEQQAETAQETSEQEMTKATEQMSDGIEQEIAQAASSGKVAGGGFQGVKGGNGSSQSTQQPQVDMATGQVVMRPPTPKDFDTTIPTDSGSSYQIKGSKDVIISSGSAKVQQGNTLVTQALKKALNINVAPQEIERRKFQKFAQEYQQKTTKDSTPRLFRKKDDQDFKQDIKIREHEVIQAYEKKKNRDNKAVVPPPQLGDSTSEYASLQYKKHMSLYKNQFAKYKQHAQRYKAYQDLNSHRVINNRDAFKGPYSSQQQFYNYFYQSEFNRHLKNAVTGTMDERISNLVNGSVPDKDCIDWKLIHEKAPKGVEDGEVDRVEIRKNGKLVKVLTGEKARESLLSRAGRIDKVKHTLRDALYGDKVKLTSKTKAMLKKIIGHIDRKTKAKKAKRAAAKAAKKAQIAKQKAALAAKRKAAKALRNDKVRGTFDKKAIQDIFTAHSNAATVESQINASFEGDLKETKEKVEGYGMVNKRYTHAPMYVAQSELTQEKMANLAVPGSSPAFFY